MGAGCKRGDTRKRQVVGGAMRMRRGPSKDLWERALGRGDSKCKEGHRLDVFDKPPGASVTGAEGAGGE